MMCIYFYCYVCILFSVSGIAAYEVALGKFVGFSAMYVMYESMRSCRIERKPETAELRLGVYSSEVVTLDKSLNDWC